MDAVCSVCVKNDGFDNDDCYTCDHHYGQLEEQIIISAVSGMKSTDHITAENIVNTAMRIVRKLKQERDVD